MVEKSNFKHGFGAKLFGSDQNAFRHVDTKALYKSIDTTQGIAKPDCGRRHSHAGALNANTKITAESQLHAAAKDIAIE